MLARTVVDRHLGDRRREGVGERRDEMRPAVASQHPVHDRAPISPEHAPVVAHPNADDGRGHTVHDPRGETTEQRIAAAHPPPADHVDTVGERRQEARDLLGRILEVGVERDDDVAPRPLHSTAAKSPASVIDLRYSRNPGL